MTDDTAVYELQGSSSTSRYRLRKVMPDDAEMAAEAEQICFPPNEACTRENMKKRVQCIPELFLVAIDNDRGSIAGYICGIATDEDHLRDEMFTDISLHDKDGRNVMILSVGVLPAYRRQGLATLMMKKYLSVEKSRGRENVVLTCLESKVSMYAGMGYEDLGISGSEWGGEQWHEMIYHLRENPGPGKR